MSKKNYIKQYDKGVTNKDLDAKLDLVLEHVIGTDKNVESLQEDMQEVKTRLTKIEVTLVGKADTSRVERLERQVMTLEH